MANQADVAAFETKYHAIIGEYFSVYVAIQLKKARDVLYLLGGELKLEEGETQPSAADLMSRIVHKILKPLQIIIDDRIASDDSSWTYTQLSLLLDDTKTLINTIMHEEVD